MRVTALAGGVGAAKLLIGLQDLLREELTAVVNVGDDASIYGAHVSPDIDIVTYWLAGIADTERGWGIKDDTFTVVEALAARGGEAWFQLGDRDFATCLYRTERLRSGDDLSSVTADIARSLGVAARILPATDDPVRTRVVTAEGETLDFQEYFVRRRCEPEVGEVLFAGISEAQPAAGVLDAIETADRVIVCPSNPILSIGPILGLPLMRDALRLHPDVLAVSPIIGGRALKGPADRLLVSLGYASSATAVASLYADFATTFVLDSADRDEEEAIDKLGLRSIACDTVMTDHAASTRLAQELLDA
ncbi:MAG: 2-phospho-L-lactate transferase [Actinomycetota bacterium]